MVVANNLLNGPAVQVTSDSEIELRDNVTAADLSDAFADSRVGDLHMKKSTKSLRQVAKRTPAASSDIDGDSRPDRPTAGADESARTSIDE